VFVRVNGKVRAPNLIFWKQREREEVDRWSLCFCCFTRPRAAIHTATRAGRRQQCTCTGHKEGKDLVTVKGEKGGEGGGGERA
jgi:hypothetical protein